MKKQMKNEFNFNLRQVHEVEMEPRRNQKEIH